MRIRHKLLLISEGVLLVAVLALLLPVRHHMRQQVVDDLQQNLRAIAATGALELDGDLHAQIRDASARESAAFVKLRDQLARIRDANGLKPDYIYTFFPDGDKLRFGVMTHDTPFVGDPYEMQPGIRRVLDTGEIDVTGLYSDAHGEWISARAPIRNGAGAVVGVLEVTQPAAYYFRRYRYVTLLTASLGLIALAISSILGWNLLERMVLRPMRAVRDGVTALGQRDFSHRVKLSTRDEFEDLASALNNIAQQLDVARIIQAGFFPKTVPVHPRYRVACSTVPCDATGGDYFDVFRLSDNRLAVLVADVSGHGLGSSLIMSACRSTLRALASADLQPRELVQRLDDLLEADLNDGRFITMIYGVFDADGNFTFTNAGHGPALLLRDGHAEALPPHRPPLGIRVEIPDEELQSSLPLAPGDRILLASDGVSEAMNPAGELFGNERLERIVADSGANCFQVLERLQSAVSDHARGRAQSDDITIVCIDRI